MERQLENSLLQAIKKDDIKAFNALMEKAQCGAYRLGRFPVLSLLYLFRSRKILKEYEERFLTIATYEELAEPIEVSKKFSAKARKCLRLYLDEVVSPLEMLLILDRTQHLKKVFPMTKPASAVKGRLKAIYSIKYSLNVRYAGDSISLDRRPLSRREKKRLATACVSAVLIIAIVIGVPVTTVSLLPKDGEVATFSDIKFDSAKEFTLKNDIVVTEDFTAKNMNCSIKGNGKKLILKKGVSLGELNGKVSDLTIETAGDPIFTSLTVKASIENVTINVNADVSTENELAFVVMTNYGLLDGVTVNVSGKVEAHAAKDADPENPKDIAFGGIVQHNAYKVDQYGNVYGGGRINDCTVNYSQFILKGESGVNATYGGIVGVNDGVIIFSTVYGGQVTDCTVNGEIIADTFDTAGICSENNGWLADSVNNARISQTSAGKQWNPNVAGIVLSNYCVITSSANTAELSAVSTAERKEGDRALSSIAAGIACSNLGQVRLCKNDGAVVAKGHGNAYAGGIVAQTFSSISYCLSSGAIAVDAPTSFAGGIAGIFGVLANRYRDYGAIEACIVDADITVTADADGARVGGIVGYVHEQRSLIAEVYYSGGVNGCYFLGECTANLSYIGAIIGVCDINVYTVNKYVGDDYDRFGDNFYLNSASSVLGATLTTVVEGETTKENYAVATENKGATAASLEYISNLESYKAILQAIAND